MNIPNRYGGADYYHEGVLCCRHSVALHATCDRCEELLSWITDPSRMPLREDGVPEHPTLVGTGDVVVL